MIGLVDLPEAAFQEYRGVLARDYGQDKVRAGAWSADEAEDTAARELDELLPKGTDTEGHFLYAVRDESIPAIVGNLRLAVFDSSVGRSVWIYDILIHDQFRRQGYGARALGVVEEKASLGAGNVGLHVFGHNEAARSLYTKMGYDTTSVVMSKRLDPEEG